jgi:hypothetical protein
MIDVSVFRRLVDEFKEDAGKGLKEMIEDSINFHVLKFMLVANFSEF